jgi:hypothetical protein
MPDKKPSKKELLERAKKWFKLASDTELDFSCEPKMNTREARKRLDALLARMDKG